MIAAGIDLGGTKSEVQLFDTEWNRVDARRDPTPREYPDLLELMADQIAWAEARAGGALPIGIGAAGLVDRNGNAFAANLSAHGHPFPAEIAARAQGPVSYVNDCRALALSEAIFGAGRGHDRVMSLILGTGIGGGLAVGGALSSGPTGLGGEYGHVPMPAHLAAAFDLPILRCGCGRDGCYETVLAGPGLSRWAERRLGDPLLPVEVAGRRSTEPEVAALWRDWCAVAAQLLVTMVQMADPDCIVVAGGMSHIAGLPVDLSNALAATQFDGFAIPQILCAEGGDASGAKGAAYAAWQEAGHGG